MARMSIDDSVARDPRITMLSEMLGWSRRETVGCLVQDVWPICYDQVTHLVSPRLIDIAAKHVGFADAMIECELASRDRSGKVQIRGAKKRVKYILDKQSAGREGGLKSAESRTKDTKQPGKQTGKQAEAAGNPIPTLTPNASPPDPVPPSAPVPESPPDRKKQKPSPPAPVAPPGSAEAIDSFHQYFMRTHGGEKPSWAPVNLKRMHDLVRAHGLETVQKRIANLETSPPSWPSAPWDLKTLVDHFDKVASPNRRGPNAQTDNGMAELFARANGESR